MPGLYRKLAEHQLSIKEGYMSRPNPSCDRRIGDTSPSKPNIQILIGKWTKFPLYLANLPIAKSFPVEDNTHFHSLGIQAISDCTPQHAYYSYKA